MKGDFCRMCGSTKLKREKRDVFLDSQNKEIKGIMIWICENCGEEFLEDSSREELYANARRVKREKSIIS